MADLDELLAQRMAERDQLEASIQYASAPVPIYGENEQKQQQPITGNFTYDASIPPPLPNSSNNLNIEYFIEFYDGKRMKIMADGELETYPPIIQFNNQFDKQTNFFKEQMIKQIDKLGDLPVDRFVDFSVTIGDKILSYKCIFSMINIFFLIL